MALEDFTSYTESDPNSHLAVTATRATFTDYADNENIFLSSDKGAAYFNGDFTHLVDMKITAYVSGADNLGIWAVTNSVVDMDPTPADGALFLRAYNTGGTNYFALLEASGGVEYAIGTQYTFSLNTTYYLKIVRDEAVGAFGTLYLYIYSDAARTTLLATKSGALHTSKQDFRYLFGVTSYRNSGAGANTKSGYVENLAESLTYGNPSATNQAVSAIAATTATGNGNVTSRGIPLATQHGHVWATHPINPEIAYTLQDNYTENGAPSATGAYTSNLVNLIQNTVYYVRSYIKNTIGTFYGKEVNFPTTADKPVVTTVEAMAVVVTTTIGHGKITNTGGVAVTAHGFVWDTSTINTGIAPTAQPNYTDEGTGVVGDFYTAITNLTALTTYKLRAYATNGNGYTYGAEITIITLASGTPIISAQECTNDAGISATGHGTILDIGAAEITAYGHVWSTSTINMSITPASQPGYKDNGAYDGTPPTAFTSQITLLTAGTTYYVRPYATNSFGNAWGDEVTLDRSVGGEDRRVLSIGKNHKLYFTDDDGVDCVIEGTAI